MSKEKLHRGDIWKYYDNITQQDRKFFILTVYEHHCDVLAENYFSSTEDDKYLKFPLWFDEFEGLNPTFVGKSNIDIEQLSSGETMKRMIKEYNGYYNKFKS